MSDEIAFHIQDEMSDEIPIHIQDEIIMSDEVPLHIQEEIIKRLPVVSLLRFRSVSKAWKALIDSSDFIVSHSVHAQPQHLLLRYEDPVESAEKYFYFVDDETFPHQRRFVHTVPLSIKLLIGSSIVGSSFGLLCLRGYYGEGEDFSPNLETAMVVLWNPSIRKSITVPVPKNSDPEHETDLGFGVCPVSGDPKIVEITQFSKTRYHCEAKVYNVSSGKWTSVSTNLPTKPFRIFWPQVNIDRFVYWCAFDPMTMDNGLPNHNLIMSFDITTENFGVIDLPDCLRHHSPTQLYISKRKESIVMLEYDSFVKRACGVWMMENGVENSFTKLFTVEAPDWSRAITVLAFRTSGQPLMEVENGHEFIEQSELVVYEPNSQRFNDLEIYGTTETFLVNSYMETLILLGQSNCNVEDEVAGI